MVLDYLFPDSNEITRSKQLKMDGWMDGWMDGAKFGLEHLWKSYWNGLSYTGPTTSSTLAHLLTSEPILGQLGRLFIPFRNCLWNILNNHSDKRRSVLVAPFYRNPLIDCYLHLVCRHLSIYRLSVRICSNKATKLIVHFALQTPPLARPILLSTVTILTGTIPC